MADILVVHGPTGSGKTTQCERLASEGIGDRPVQHVSAGNRLRDIRAGTATSELSDYINSPNVPRRLPDSVVHRVIFEAFHDTPAGDIFITEGYPSFPHAVDDFLTALHEDGHTLVGVVDFVVSPTTSKRRVLARGPRAGEPTSPEKLGSWANWHYQRYNNTAAIALMSLAKTFPSGEVDASGDKDQVYAEFSSVVRQLLLPEAHHSE